MVNEPHTKSESLVGLIMGSSSDWKTMRHAAETLEALGLRCEACVVSAHRTPDDMFAYAEQAESRGLSLIIAAAGGAAHLPGMTAAKTVVPVIGVPVVATPLGGIDALLSILQMPAGIGVATVNIGEQGAKHAAQFAGSILQCTGSKVTLVCENEADREVLQHAEETLQNLDIAFDSHVVSGTSAGFTQKVESMGTSVYIVASRHEFGLVRELASHTKLPVLGVPTTAETIERIDHFVRPLSTMPTNVAMFAVGRPGAINAALFAATIGSPLGSATRDRLWKMREEQVERVRAMTLE